MIPNIEKLQILKDILLSPEFKDSKRSQELLQYLVNAAIDGKSPKEITIAIEFFGKDSAFEPKEDPTVRVQINNLRKKLDHYYLTTESLPEYRLEIPKGHYRVEFVPVVRPVIVAARPNRTILALAAVILVLAVTLIVVLTQRNAAGNQNRGDFAHNPLWSDFFHEGGKPILVVLGDYFFLFDKSFTEKPGIIIRNPRINSIEDLRTITSKDPSFAQRFVQSDFTFLRPSASWGIAEILPILKETPHAVSLKLASQMTLEDLKDYNVIFIGSFKTLHRLNRILHQFHLEYQILPPQFTVRGEGKDSTVSFHSENVRGGEYERDYAVIAKGLGPEGTSIMLVLGFGDAGVLQAAKLVADPALPSRMRAANQEFTLTSPFQCILVLQAEGINQTGFKTALKYFKQYPPTTTASPAK